MANYVTLLVYEVFEKVVKAKTRKEKIDVLRQNDSQALKDVLMGTFDSRVEWNLPEGRPPFESAPEENPPTNLLKQTASFLEFVKGGPGDNQPAFRREATFIRLIEKIHPKDAEVILAMVSKKSLGKGITKKLVEEAFPGLIH